MGPPRTTLTADQRYKSGMFGNHPLIRPCELDPRYAEAYSGLADAYTALGYTSYWAPKIRSRMVGSSRTRRSRLIQASQRHAPHWLT